MQLSKDWIKDLIIYQIYPRSFCDSNGDGIGDLPGILSRLDHLSDLGVNALWLSPVYRSPNDDNGYDISGYQEIMEEFGSMEDWDRLRDACRERGIRIIMDMVVNHSSDEHPWFTESRSSRDNPKSEYYIWRDPVDGHEPNNWASCFGSSAWEFVPERGQYYFHYFSKKQPDLNWACPELREEIFSMMNWWVAKGVEGFRVDAISYLDKPQDFPDSKLPPRPDGYSFPDCLTCRPGTHGHILEMNRRVYSPGNVMTVGEVSAPTVEELANYVRTEREEFDMAIPFVPPIEEINTWSPEKLKHDAWESYRIMPEDGWWARFLSNHDKPRQVSLYGDDGEYWETSAKLLAMFIHTLPGTPFIYQGEEIGMTNVSFPSIEDYDDPSTRDQYHQYILSGMDPSKALSLVRLESRDNARTPMQWDSSENSGFTTGKPWLKVNQNALKINVAAQRQDPHSIYSCYKNLIALRKTCPSLSRGGLCFLDTGCPELIGLTRSYEGKGLLVFLNFSKEGHTIPSRLLENAGAVLMSSYDREGGYQGENLRPYEAVIFKMKD